MKDHRIEDYEKILHGAPDHNKQKFLEYLRENNKVVHEDNIWIVIENCKYHTEERAHHTAFYKPNGQVPAYLVPKFAKSMYWGWEVRIKREADRTVGRWHVHFIE